MEVLTLRYGEIMRDDVVKFKVGTESKEYFVHPGLLLRHSEYFVRALTGSWKEAAENAIRLDDIDCETFEIFVEWLYTQRYPTSAKFAQNEPGKAGCALQLGRVKACEFGDRFQAPTFLRLSESALVDCLISGEHAPFYSAVIYAFKNLPSESVVLQAFIDNHCRHWNDGADTEENGELALRDELPHAFLLGVALRYMRIRYVPWKQLDRCDYHNHTTEERGKKCKVPRIDKYPKVST